LLKKKHVSVMVRILVTSKTIKTDKGETRRQIFLNS